jgi:hypothetical protein
VPETAKQKRAYRRLVGTETPTEIYPEATTKAIEAATPMVAIELKKNYRPEGAFEIAGYWQDEIKRKNPMGQEVIVQKREFIPGEAKPALVAGVGFASKIWAGTVVKLPRDEAKAVKQAGIGEYELVD